MKNVNLPGLRPDDFVPLETFELAWRWTDAKYALFSEEDLRSIRPLAPAAAQRIAKPLESLVAPHGLAAESFANIEHTPASGDVESVTRWLQARVPDRDLSVYVVWWHGGHVVRVPWELFARRWNDFCYPSSDDVSVYPVTSGWMALYGHHEELWFGREAAP